MHLVRVGHHEFGLVVAEVLQGGDAEFIKSWSELLKKEFRFLDNSRHNGSKKSFRQKRALEAGTHIAGRHLGQLRHEGFNCC
jgi:hypothetical protein